MPSIETLAMILAGGEGRRLDVLSEKRAKPAVPFGGKYRIIDFCLSNCVNSGIYYVGVLTQYNPRSLHEHIKIGKAWDLDRIKGGVFILQPYISDERTNWYRGTADAIYQNLRFIRDINPGLVLILSGDHIYKMDYRKMIKFHLEREAEVTISAIEVPWEEASRFGIMEVNEEGRVIGFEEKPRFPASNLASMGIYVFSRDILEEEVKKEAMREGTSYDFGKDVIPRLITRNRVFAYRFEEYWKDVGTLTAFWEANMELLQADPPLNLRDDDWPIYTPLEDRPPVKLGRTAVVENSIIGSGSVINGIVEHSVIFGGVYVAEGARVVDSIVMNDSKIGENSFLDRVIIDKQVIVEREVCLGKEDETWEGESITVVGKNCHIPSGTVIGKGCRIGPDLAVDDFPGLLIKSGTVLKKPGYSEGLK